MSSRRTSSCCLGLFICGIVSVIGLLSLILLYWSIPSSNPIPHHLTKVSAERFTSDAELHEASPGLGHASHLHSQVLFTWQHPLCAETPDVHKHGPVQSRFHVQYWLDRTWHDLLRSLSSFNTGEPGSIYTNDCFAVLENASTSRQISFRVRSRVDPGAIFQLLQPQWSAWSDTVVLAPSRKELLVCEHADGRGPYHWDQLWWGLTLISVVAAVYSRWRSTPGSVRGAAKRKISALQDEVHDLKQELSDAETENKLLMRLKGYGLDTLTWKELHELEHELHLGLDIIEQYKEALHPVLVDAPTSPSSSSCSSSS